jgi:hypothetical protein
MNIKKKAAKKRAGRDQDHGMGALLGLLKGRPDLVHALIFDHVQVKNLLKSRAARILVPGVDARKMLLRRVAGGPASGPPPRFMAGGYPVPNTAIQWIGGSIKAYCLKGTYYFCGRPARE